MAQDEKPRPLTKDQKLQNTMFMRILKEQWEDARKQLLEGVEAALNGETAGAAPAPVDEDAKGGDQSKAEAGSKDDAPKAQEKEAPAPQAEAAAQDPQGDSTATR
jgi:hypothetical protein